MIGPLALTESAVSSTIVVGMVPRTMPRTVWEFILECSIAESVVSGRSDNVPAFVVTMDDVKGNGLLWSASGEILPVLRILQSIVKRTASAVSSVVY